MASVRTLLIVCVFIAGCSPRSSEVKSGDYHYLTAGASAQGVPAEMRMHIDRESARVQLIDATGSFLDSRLAVSDEKYRVCPGGDKEPLLLIEPVPLPVGPVTFTMPALRGQCMDGLPHRVALIDLAVRDESLVVAYTHWVEFCLIGDFGCNSEP